MHAFVGWLLEPNLMWMQIYEPLLGLSSTFRSGHTCVVGRQQLRQSTWVLSELWVAFNCVGTFPPPTHHLDFITLITPNCLVQQQMWICQTKNAIKGEAAQGALYEDCVGTHLATCLKTRIAQCPSLFLSYCLLSQEILHFNTGECRIQACVLATQEFAHCQCLQERSGRVRQPAPCC